MAGGKGGEVTLLDRLIDLERRIAYLEASDTGWGAELKKLFDPIHGHAHRALERDGPRIDTDDLVA